MGNMVVIGASPNPKKYSYIAIRKLLLRYYKVIPIGTRSGSIGTCSILTDRPLLEDVDFVILYINSKKQKEYYNYILQLKPKRILFNPGTENPELVELARENDIEVIYDCAICLINAGNLPFN